MTRRVAALEAGGSGLAAEPVGMQAAVEYLTPRTYADDLRYNGGPTP
jgi:hypothetical protein